MFFEGGWFATEHDFIGPIRYQLRSGPEVELGAEEVLERYRSIEGLSDGEMELARQGMLEDYRFLQATHASHKLSSMVLPPLPSGTR